MKISTDIKYSNTKFVSRSKLCRKDHARSLRTETLHEERVRHHEHAERPPSFTSLRRVRARPHSRACS